MLPSIRISAVTIRNAQLGQTVQLDAQLTVNKTFGTSPVLEISVSTSSGQPLPCAYTAVPKVRATRGISAIDYPDVAFTDNSIVQVESVTVKNAKLGQRIRIDAKSRVYKTTNLEPVAEISVTTSSGTPLPCVYSAMPKQLKTCDGDTLAERILTSEWGNTCPVQPGLYTAHIAFKLPDSPEARSCVGIKFDATVLVKTTVGQNPVLELSFSQSDGTKIPCVDEVVPCNLSLCDGTTRIEKHLNKDWDNTCPVQRGTYSAELEFRLPGSEAKKYFGVS
ncbi:hypothetical protein MTO96_004038 [Rhipicephalus appendiculatus]